MPAFRGHDSARKFHCDVPGCSASFVKRAHLRRHEMTHTQRRDFSCPGCNRAFSRNDSMARHLRRKHPHLYRSSEATSTATTGVERLYTGGVTSVAGPSASINGLVPGGGYSLLSLRSPFDNSASSPVLRRSDDYRTLPDLYERPTTSSDVYSRESNLYSPKGLSLPQWRGIGSSRMPESYYAAPPASQSDGVRACPSRFGFSVKEDPDAPTPSGPPPLFSSTNDLEDRTYPTRRPINEQGNPFYRPEVAQTPGSYGGGSLLERGATQAPHGRMAWDRQEQATSSVNSGGPDGWNAAGAPSGAALVQYPEDGRREHGRSEYPGAGCVHQALPSGLQPIAMAPSGSGPSTEVDLLQSEFFIEAMQSRGEEACWTSLDPCMLTAQSAERVRVETGPEPGQQYPDASFAPPCPSISPSGRSVTAADTYFAVDFRGLCDQAAPVDPPNAGQVEQIMAELGIDFGASQASAVDASQSFAAQNAFAQPGLGVSAAPLIPSQGGGTSAPWASERLAPAASGFHLASMSQSQAQSSQSSIYLPSLTASQNEYLGPNATSHRRTMDRVMSSASMAFDVNSQARASQRRSPSLAGDLEESQGRPIGTSSESQETRADDAIANFHKPHDSSLSQRAAQDEEGGRKSIRVEHHPQPAGCISDGARFAFSHINRDGISDSRREDRDAAMAMEAGRIAMPPPPDATDKGSTLMIPPRQDHGERRESKDTAEMEMDEPPLPEDMRQRNSSASISTSAVSGDQLQQVVERFRVFAQLCQDHLHPSTEMLDCLAPLLDKVIHADAPFFHPKMIGSQKVHSHEEAFALLSLASLKCSDPHLQEEGHRLVCFLYGLVMLSYKHTLHLGGKLQSLLNCFLLVGMYGMRQCAPDLWHKFEENRESILLDVLKAETRESILDPAMDRIEAIELQDLSEEDLFLLWERWYEHESRKRTLLACAILDSQSSSHFSPFNIDLAARPEGPRCQFLFAHVHEPCPDNVFVCWPPKTWATRLESSISLPSAKVAEIAFHDGQPASIAACLTEKLLRPHVTHVHGSAPRPPFRSSFDFGARNGSAQGSKLPRWDGDRSDSVPSTCAAPFVEVAEASTSARSSRRPSRTAEDEEACDPDKLVPEVRIVSQLYMLALLEAVHGAWMTDSGWYQTPAWGTNAMPEQLDIDAEDFDVGGASLTDLPGWRVGRTLHATQVAHALMNWSEMFSGWKDGCHTKGDEAAAELGLKLTYDTHQSTIRWQAIFLGLCAPLQSLCFYLDSGKRSNEMDRERYRRVSVLLGMWVESAYCRRALVHASTILTLLCAFKTKCRNERLGPATSNAVYMSLVTLTATSKILGEREAPPKRAATKVTFEELIPVKQVWPILVNTFGEGEQEGNETKAAGSSDAKQDDHGSGESEDWLRVRFWHRKFQFLGLAGIFREHETDRSTEMYADWRMSVSAGAGVGGSMGVLRAAHLRPRWSSCVGDGRWPTARRETIHAHHASSAEHRRPSHAGFSVPQLNADRDLLRRAFAGTNSATETRRWILRGATNTATFCGLPLSSSDDAHETEPNGRQAGSEACKVFGRKQLRELVMWVRDDNPAWCFSQEYTSLLLGALQEPQSTDSGGASSVEAIRRPSVVQRDL